MYTFTAYLIAAAVAAVSVSAAQDHFAIGMASVPVPSGWHNVSVSPERTVWRSSDNTQQLTVSIMTFESEPSFEDFKILCSHRIDLENKGLSDGFVEPDGPHDVNGHYVMFFSGGDRATHRVFSGDFRLSKRQLLTLYLESIGKDPKEHMDLFKNLVTGMKVQ